MADPAKPPPASQGGADAFGGADRATTGGPTNAPFGQPYPREAGRACARFDRRADPSRRPRSAAGRLAACGRGTATRGSGCAGVSGRTHVAAAGRTGAPAASASHPGRRARRGRPADHHRAGVQGRRLGLVVERPQRRQQRPGHPGYDRCGELRDVHRVRRRSASCSWSSSRCSAATRWPARPVGRRCGTCLPLPVPRSRLLRQKLIVAVGFSVAVNVLLPAWAYLVGGAVFGWAPARSPISGEFSRRPDPVAVRHRRRLRHGPGAAPSPPSAFLLSVVTDAPLGAVGGATFLVVISNILDSITSLDPYRRVLPTHFQYSWLDALGPSVQW